VTEEIYSAALMNALIEIKNAYTPVKWAFLITKNGTVIISQENASNPNIAQSASSFQSLVEKAGAVGGLESILINGEKGKIHVSCINDMYLVAGLAKNVDLVYFRNITGTVLSTILKVIEGATSNPSISPTTKLAPTSKFSSAQTPIDFAALQPTIEENPKEEEFQEAEERGKPATPELSDPEEFEADQQLEGQSSQQLIVDKLGGLMVKSDTVQLDSDVLKQWSILDQEEISEVEIETLGGKTARFKAKEISDSKLENRGLIRIPVKACQALEIKRGELVKVKPIKLEKTENEEKIQEYYAPGYSSSDAYTLSASSPRM
jgi:predicted regulator of Ras-like GTPase activity (Roadblock/LC7/MglB family)